MLRPRRKRRPAEGTNADVVATNQISKMGARRSSLQVDFGLKRESLSTVPGMLDEESQRQSTCFVRRRYFRRSTSKRDSASLEPSKSIHCVRQYRLKSPTAAKLWARTRACPAGRMRTVKRNRESLNLWLPKPLARGSRLCGPATVPRWNRTRAITLIFDVCVIRSIEATTL